MNQREAVIEVVKANGGYATLGFLYQEVMKVPDVTWNTKTPFASIRRIVQDERFFFKIRPGLWALNEYRNVLPEQLQLMQHAPETRKEELNHTYYQGLLVQIGNLEKKQTFVPYQDKNRLFLDKPLHEVASLKEFYTFGYERFVARARTVDVTWFNQRDMPEAMFEIEHSTDIYNSLLKFIALQDFNIRFFIVADESKDREFEKKFAEDVFRPLQQRVQFLAYDRVANWHTKSFELSLVKPF